MTIPQGGGASSAAAGARLRGCPAYEAGVRRSTGNLLACLCIVALTFPSRLAILFFFRSSVPLDIYFSASTVCEGRTTRTADSGGETSPPMPSSQRHGTNGAATRTSAYTTAQRRPHRHWQRGSSAPPPPPATLLLGRGRHLSQAPLERGRRPWRPPPARPQQQRSLAGSLRPFRDALKASSRIGVRSMLVTAPKYGGVAQRWCPQRSRPRRGGRTSATAGLTTPRARVAPRS